MDTGHSVSKKGGACDCSRSSRKIPVVGPPSGRYGVPRLERYAPEACKFLAKPAVGQLVERSQFLAAEWNGACSISRAYYSFAAAIKDHFGYYPRRNSVDSCAVVGFGRAIELRKRARARGPCSFDLAGRLQDSACAGRQHAGDAGASTLSVHEGKCGRTGSNHGTYTRESTRLCPLLKATGFRRGLGRHRFTSQRCRNSRSYGLVRCGRRGSAEIRGGNLRAHIPVRPVRPFVI